MKIPTIIGLLAVGAVVNAYGQGYIHFANFGPGWAAPVKDPWGNYVGPSYSARLSVSDFDLVGYARFIADTGLFDGGVQELPLPLFSPGDRVLVAVEAWWGDDPDAFFIPRGRSDYMFIELCGGAGCGVEARSI